MEGIVVFNFASQKGAKHPKSIKKKFFKFYLKLYSLLSIGLLFSFLLAAFQKCTTENAGQNASLGN